MKPTNLTSLTSLWTAARRYFFLLAWALVLTNAAQGQAVVVVTNTSDVIDGATSSISALDADNGPDGGISLREAMKAVNNTPNGTAPDEIHFNIPGAGPHTIQPLSGLPKVTDPVVIDGYTQAGASENTNTAGSGLGLNTVLMIEMDGSNAPGSGLFIEAGSTTVRGLVLNRYPHKAIEMLYLGGNRIEGNFIGTDVTGTVDLGNAISGVVIANGSSNNVVGGTDPGARNLISGNDNDGIVISGHPVAVTGNAVLGNFIGTDVNGNVALSNGSPSTNEWASGIVLVNSASNNVVGGTDPGARNLISGNTEYGVLIRSGASDNVVQGNYIGTDVTGTVTDDELGNGSPNLSADGGVGVEGGSMNNTIGGGAPGAGNLISGNDNAGIQLSTNATANTVQGNKIGTDKTGMAALGNSKGVSIGYGAHHNIIGTNSDGTDDSTEGNLISGNQSNGVFISGSGSGAGADNNVIAGNYIGTDVTGTLALGNGSGIRIHQPSGPSSAPQFNRIGTDGDGVADAEERNLIAGNNAEGILIEGDNTTVAGNYIGTDVTGTLALGNEGVGANIVDGQWNRVGTNSDGVADLAERNLISANGGGVNIGGLDAQHNTVAGNYIGTDVSGTNLLGNDRRGVSISGRASFNWIGTNGDGVRDLTERNVIAANGEAGILISTSDHNVVAGNYIGTDVTGANPLGNGRHGVWLSGANTPVASNRIGTDADGTADAEEANLIAFNAEAGVAFNAYTGDLMSVSNRVQGNAIHSNGGLGIDLVGGTEDPTGVTANDSGDADAGPNALQNFPVISSAASGATSTTIDGTLDSTPSTAFTLEFFASSAADPSGHGEGETFLGSTSITTDGSGNTLFSVTLSAVAPVGAFITSTATDPGGNTSEFSGTTMVVPSNTPPLVGTVTAPIIPVEVNTEITCSADFTDPDAGDTHTAEWDWGDNTTTPGTVTEPNGGPGTVTGTHTYDTPGVYTVTVTVTDSFDESDEAVFQFVVVFDPDGGFVTGGGWIDSPTGAYPADPLLTGTANFGFISKYKKGKSIPEGQTEFQFQVADLNFHSDVYEWLVVAGPHAKYKGTGTINQAGNYGFLLTATDENLTPSTDVDLFRIKIWDKDNNDTVVYDNKMGESDDSNAGTEITGGNIVIHSGNGNGGGPNKTGEQADPVADSAEVPEVYALAPNYPNPFNPTTEIRFDLPEASVVQLVIYDVMGREVARLVDEALPAGQHRAKWEAPHLPSGVYLYRLTAGAFSQAKAMTLLK